MVSYTMIGIVVAVILLIIAIVWYVMASRKLSISIKNVGKTDVFAIKVFYTNGTAKVFRDIKPGMTKNIMFKLNDTIYAKSIIIQPENSDKDDVDLFIEMNLLKGSKVIKKYLNTDDSLTKKDFVSSNNWAMEKKPDEVLRNIAESKIQLYWASNRYDPAWPFIISNGRITMDNNAKTIEGDISGALIDLNVDFINNL